MQDLITFLSGHPILGSTAATLIVLLIFIELMRAKQGSLSLDAIRATHMINHDHAVVIDLRSKDAFKTGHIIDAYSMTQDDMKNTPKKLEKFKTRPIIVVCATGHEAQKVAAMLLKQGYNAYSLSGGIRGWTEAQMPLIKE